MHESWERCKARYCAEYDCTLSIAALLEIVGVQKMWRTRSWFYPSDMPALGFTWLAAAQGDDIAVRKCNKL